MTVSELQTSPPPPATTAPHTWVLDDRAQLRDLWASLRTAVDAHAGAGGNALSEVAENMVLVATELASNAIKHGLPPTTVALPHTDDEFVLDVADHDLDTIPELAETRPHHSGGRGLHLATDTTKHVWAAFPIHP